MNHIGAAVSGTGFIGPIHVEGLKRLGVNVRGILGSTPEKSDEASKRLGLEHGYHSFEEILSDERVHSVHLAVPNVLHYRMARRALEAGKHVMCEKPLAMTAQESAELVDLASTSRLAAGVCYNTRFYPLNLEARAKVARGEIGELYSVQGSYAQDWLLYDTDFNWRVEAQRGGALRAVSDIGTHWIDLVCSITGLEVESVFADLQTVHSVRKRPLGEIATYSSSTDTKTEPVEITTEDAGAILFRFKEGQRGVLWVSQVTAGRKNSMQYEIAGSKGALAWHSDTPNILWTGYRDRPNEVLTRDPTFLSSLASSYSDYPGGHNEGFPDTFKQCFRAFYTAIAEKLSPEEALYPTFAEGHREIQLCDAILESHLKERWIAV